MRAPARVIHLAVGLLAIAFGLGAGFTPSPVSASEAMPSAPFSYELDVISVDTDTGLVTTYSSEGPATADQALSFVQNLRRCAKNFDNRATIRAYQGERLLYKFHERIIGTANCADAVVVETQNANFSDMDASWRNEGVARDLVGNRSPQAQATARGSAASTCPTVGPCLVHDYPQITMTVDYRGQITVSSSAGPVVLPESP